MQTRPLLKGNMKMALVLPEIVNAMKSGAFLFKDLKRFRFCPRMA